MRLLLIEDSERLRRSVGTGLRKAGYAVDDTGDGEEGLWYARSHEYDLIVLDLMLPGLDGLSILKSLRGSERNTPVLILTARDSVEDRVRGLELGSDDYLVKPFAFDELLARTQALIRRSYGVKQVVLRVGDLQIDFVRRTVCRGDVPIDLAPRELALLEYLAMRQNTVLSRTEIEQHIYDGTAEPMSNSVESAVCAIRRKIDVPGQPSLIQTRRGAGYAFEAGDDL